MFRDFKLTFSKITSEFVRNEYLEKNRIIEYGSGGSTMLAAKSETTDIITVESNPFWLLELMGAYKEQNLPGNIIPIYSNIGQTKAYGHPKDTSQRDNWPSYANLPWQYSEENDFQPELVLIDGRFRVACFLSSCVNTTKSIKILFDDYVGRSYYHVVEDIIKPSKFIDNRLAVFEVEPNMIDAKYITDNIKYFYDPS